MSRDLLDGLNTVARSGPIKRRLSRTTALGSLLSLALLSRTIIMRLCMRRERRVRMLGCRDRVRRVRWVRARVRDRSQVKWPERDRPGRARVRSTDNNNSNSNIINRERTSSRGHSHRIVVRRTRTSRRWLLTRTGGHVQAMAVMDHR